MTCAARFLDDLREIGVYTLIYIWSVCERDRGGGDTGEGGGQVETVYQMT